MKRLKQYGLVFALFVFVYLTVDLVGWCLWLMTLPSNIAFGGGILGIAFLVMLWGEFVFNVVHKILKHEVKKENNENV